MEKKNVSILDSIKQAIALRADQVDIRDIGEHSH